MNKSINFLVHSFFVGICFLFSLAATAQTEKILVAGDSWAVLMCQHNSFGTALGELKQNFTSDSNCTKASANGAEAKNWLGRSTDKFIRTRLSEDLEIKVLVLSLGGNDLVRNWNKEMSLEQEVIIINKVQKNIETIVYEYQKIRPDIKIVISGYDYPRFEKDHPFPAYAKLFLNMKEPTAFELNSAMIRFSQEINKISDYKNIFYIHHLGLSHYYDGASEDRLPPQQTQHPDLISSLENPDNYGGDPRIMSSVKSLDNRFGFIDPYHLSKDGYHRLALHVICNVLIASGISSHRSEFIGPIN